MERNAANIRASRLRIAGLLVAALITALSAACAATLITTLVFAPPLAFADGSSSSSSSTINMSGMFEGCTSLEEVDLSDFNASANDTSDMFNDCTNLQDVDVSGINTTQANDMNNMFNNDTSGQTDLSSANLGHVTLGPNFRFKGNNLSANSGKQALLPSPPNDGTYNGKWVKVVNGAYVGNQYTSEQLRDAFDANPASMAGTYVWALRGEIVYNANGGTGSMQSTIITSASGTRPSACTFTPPPNHRFVCWNTASNGSGTSYYPDDPNSVVLPTGVVTLYAQWEYIPIEMPLSGVGGTAGIVLAVVGILLALLTALIAGARARRKEVMRL